MAKVMVSNMKFTDKKRSFALLLAALTLSTAALGSCGDAETGKTDGSTDSQPSGETEAVTEENPRFAIRENIPADANFGGYEFRIQSRDADHHMKELSAEAENGETINDAVFRRNTAVEERLNIKLVPIYETEAPETYPPEVIRKNVMAGSDYCDIALVHTLHAGTLAASGLLYNWYDIPYVDFTKPWWNKSVSDELTIGGRLYLAVSDLCLSAIDYAWCMVYNKELAANYDFADIYDLVNDGKWTIDRMDDMIADISTDLNGDGTFDDQDLYGFTTHDNSAIVNWMFALGQKVTTTDKDGIPQLTLNTERMVSIVEKVDALLHDGHQTYVVNDNYTAKLNISHDHAVASMFDQGKTLFAALRIYVIDELRNMQANFGIIPFPKYDEAQEAYYTHVDGHAPLICIPKTITDAERTGVVLEALSAESYRTCVPAVYDIVLTEKYSRDEMSVHMLDLILGGRTQNFGYVYESGNMQWSLTLLMKQGSKDFASYYKKNEKAALKGYDKIIKAHLEIDD
ncbi:MAG: hypothetical protein MJ175_09140 [Clostridia bacterium]|nr:hypothetical protein [Clostridia bacterium]